MYELVNGWEGKKNLWGDILGLMELITCHPTQQSHQNPSISFPGASLT